jgi:hypothetical protein
MEENKMVTTISPRLSWRGYNLGIAIAKNKDSLKSVIAIIGGANIMLGFDWKTLGITVLGGIIALVVKLVGDAVDYYFTDVEITKP